MKTTKALFGIFSLTVALATATAHADYITLNCPTNNFTFQGDTTYYISGPVVLTGTNTLEGGTVIKFAANSNAYIYITQGSTLNVNTAPYRPAVFTAVDDNSVGEAIGSGTPVGYYGNMGLYVDLPANSGLVLHDLRMSYLTCGLSFPSYCPNAVRDVQFVNCQDAISSDSDLCRLQNVLVQGGGSVFAGNFNASCENVTFHQITNLVQSGQSVSVCFTNSLIAMVNTSGVTISGINNQFLTGDAGVFQSAIGGADYLATNCPPGIRNAGTTNIDPDLLTDLRAKTTYPPIVYSNVTFNASLILNPQAQRDTNTMPDLGYHYDPLDYVFGGCIANSNITFTAGTAAGWFRTSSGWYHAGYGIHMEAGVTVSFNGTITAPTYWVRLNTVQEQDLSAGYGPGGIESWTVVNSPTLIGRFLRCSEMGDNNERYFSDDWGNIAAELTDCEFWTGTLGVYQDYMYYTNCLMWRVGMWLLNGSTTSSFTLRNCTFYGGSFQIIRNGSGPTPVSVRDCAFDGTSISTSDYWGSNTNLSDYDYNAYTNATDPFSAGGQNDVIVPNFNWQSSWFGNYYLPTDSPLLHHGDVPASQVGLDDFTIQTNQVVEGTNIVSIGYHYVPLSNSTPPILTSFVPVSGQVGTNVTITGVDFSPVASNNIVFFGAVQAAVTAASPTSLTVTVPVGATYAPITVTVNGLTAYSDQPFLPTFSGTGQIDSSSLASPMILPTGDGPSQVAIADLDGDSEPDLVILDAFVADISIYQNISSNGVLAFAPRVVLPMTSAAWGNPGTVVVADLDGDGKPDIIALTPQSNRISIFRNVSSPGVLTTDSFGPRIDIPILTDVQGLAVQDLNEDGRPDLVTANGSNNTVSIFQNQSTIGNISFAMSVNFTAGKYPEDVAIVDLDGDGNPDLAALNQHDNTLSVFRNLGEGGAITTNSFAPQVVFPNVPQGRHLAIGDMDGDGKLDIVSAGWTTESISVLRNLTSGSGITTSSFAAPVNFATGGWANNVSLGDLGGVGKLDVVVVSQLPSLFSIFQDISTPGDFTTGSLASRVDFSSGYNPNCATLGDLNGDGRPEIVLANSYDNNIYILANTVPSPTPPTISSEPQDAFVDAYGTASFSVTGTGASSYQWLLNGSNVLNATSSTLTISNIEPSDLGQYSVIVANSYGAVTSSVANLYMYPSIVTPFAGVVTDWGQSTTLSVGAWGSGTLMYQWYDNGVAIPNATNSTYTFSAIQFTNAGLYSVVVSSSLGSVTNTAAQVVVNTAGTSLGLYPGITVSGTVGYTYDIQSNPDLTNTNGWTTVATLTLWQPVELWVDVNHNAASPTNQHRFYRVLPAQ